MTTGFIASCFDLLHAGHISMLRECQENCDELIIALHIDPSIERNHKNKPIEPVSERWIKLHEFCRGHKFKIIPYVNEAELYNILCLTKPDVRFLGSDYKSIDYTGKDLNIPIHWIERRHNISSSFLRKKINE